MLIIKKVLDIKVLDTNKNYLFKNISTENEKIKRYDLNKKVSFNL